MVADSANDNSLDDSRCLCKEKCDSRLWEMIMLYREICGSGLCEMIMLYEEKENL